jgi:hypothetical protein
MSLNDIFQTALASAVTGESDILEGPTRERRDVIRIAPKSGQRAKAKKVFISQTSSSHAHECCPTQVAEMQQLMSLRREATRAGEYEEAHQYQQQLVSLSERAQEAATSRSAENQRRKKLVKQDELRAIVDRITADWNTSFEEFLDATRQQAEQLRRQHEADLAKLDADNQTPRHRPMTRQLTELREKERACALAGHFVDAQRAKGIADRAEMIEGERQAEAMRTDFQRRRQRLVASQKQEMTVFFAHVEATRLTMVLQREQLVAGHLTRLRKLDTAIAKLETQQGDLSECHASKDRVAIVTEGEYSYPIPRMRPGSAFTRVRKAHKEP